MQSYDFAATFIIDAIRGERRNSEHEAEHMRMDFSHHAAPLRGMEDIMDLRATVTAPRMTEEQRKAFESCLSRAMRRFQSEFQVRLLEISAGRAHD